ncbi:MAG: protein-disulfide reductase DsbD domain-containing protein [Chitinophagaceae bacterium]
MKKLYFFIVLSVVAFTLQAQSAKQVQWSYSAKKLAEKTYEVHMTATIGDSYHLYSQNAGVADGPLPTTFKFINNPLATAAGKVKEVGKMVKKYEAAWPGTVNYYENTVDFVQTVKLKGNIKTNFAGSVEFIVCNDARCLPPSTIEFKVNIGG